MLLSTSVEPTPFDQAAILWNEGQHDAALESLYQSVEHDPHQAWPYVDFARLYLMAGDPQRAREYLDAAYVLAQNFLDRARIDYAESELAWVRGDRQTQDFISVKRAHWIVPM